MESEFIHNSRESNARARESKSLGNLSTIAVMDERDGTKAVPIPAMYTTFGSSSQRGMRGCLWARGSVINASRNYETLY